VQVTGYVADPTPYLKAADAFVVPLHAGGGMRVKIVDAWLWGLPIVSTPIGAEGIQLRDGQNILLAEDAPAFAEATARLLTDADLNRQLRVNGRAWVEDRYAWRMVYPRVDEVYARLLGTGGAAPGKPLWILREIQTDCLRHESPAAELADSHTAPVCRSARRRGALSRR